MRFFVKMQFFAKEKGSSSIVNLMLNRELPSKKNKKKEGTQSSPRITPLLY